MRSYTTVLLFLALLSGVAPIALGQNPGSCTQPRAESDLDINNVFARMFNTGSLFYGNATTEGDGYLVPQASGNSPIFASGIWIGGRVDGDLRVAGSTYDRFEFWAGPLNDDGTLPYPDCIPGADSDVAEYDKIWNVTRGDILNYEGTGIATEDLETWPVSIGAPAIAAPENGFDDDCDGLTDEGSDGIDNDGDGFVDERDEQERIDPACRQEAGRSIYDLAAGDRPEIVGDQGLWWVMNDLGNTHRKSLTRPIGVEVKVLAWSFARADALNDVTFYRYTVTKKTPGDLEETYLTIFSDPDLGDAGDDLVGIDTTLSLGYIYNDSNTDAVYGIPPAAGYDFFQGPIVDLDGDGEATDTLGATSFMYFINGVDPPLSDPATGEQMYQTMQGRWTDGTPMTVGGNGFQTGGAVTTFAFPGDPVTGTGWNEISEGNEGDDRRFLVTTGPFTLRGPTPNAEGGYDLYPQDIVYGIVFARGSNFLDSITQLRVADEIAQTAYDIDFELASAPPPPPRCDRNSPNPQLHPGSGNCLEAVETDGRASLVWGYPTNSPNYLGRYEVYDRLLGGTNAPDSTYNFEAFRIYRYPNANFSDRERELVAMYDVINGVTTVIDEQFDPATGQFVPFVALTAEDTGLEYSLELQGLTNQRDYYYGITTVAYNDYSIPKVIESSATTITVRPSSVTPSSGGSVQPAVVGQQLIGNRVAGKGAATVSARVVDPTQLTGATYRVELYEFDTDGDNEDDATTFRILRDGETVFDGESVYRSVLTPVDSTNLLIGLEDQRIVIDGLEFFRVDPVEIPQAFSGTDTGLVPTIAGGGNGILEVAHPNVTVCPLNSSDVGCRYPDYLGGNTVWRSPNSTGDYVLTTPTSTLASTGVWSAAQGDDFEIRFTEDCATTGNCLGVFASALPGGSGVIASVPFELWNVGVAKEGIVEDDVRMIPMLRALDGTEASANWADTFPGSKEVIVGTDTTSLPVTHRLIGVMPDRPDGYVLFAEAARRFGGPGAVYDEENDGDEQIDIYAPNGTDCRLQNYYADFCWRGANNRFVGAIGTLDGLQLADLDGDGTTPPAGTTIRFVTTHKPDLAIGDVVEFNTAEYAFETENLEVARQSLEQIGIVPNPYMGVSDYETNNLDRVVRFTNLPDQATIRIFTVAGTLIRTLQKDGPSRTLDWNLETHNNLPVASGMYLIHVDVPGVGERVLKFGVVNRQNRITIF